VVGYKEPESNSRYGLMPDGTPCVDTDYQTTFREKIHRIRRSGRQAKCIQGYCQVCIYTSTASTVLILNLQDC